MLRGRYFFGGYVTRRVSSCNLRVNGSSGEASRRGSGPRGTYGQSWRDDGAWRISAFGVDAAGELYIVNDSAGTMLKIGGAPSAPTNVRITR